MIVDVGTPLTVKKAMMQAIRMMMATKRMAAVIHMHGSQLA